MNKKIKIAVDAMGGDGSPGKVINGIIHHFNNNKETFYQIFGDKNKIERLISKDLLKEFSMFKDFRSFIGFVLDLCKGKQLFGTLRDST